MRPFSTPKLWIADVKAVSRRGRNATFPRTLDQILVGLVAATVACYVILGLARCVFFVGLAANCDAA